MSRAHVGGKWAYTPDEAITWYRPRFAGEAWYTSARPLIERLVAAVRPTTPAAAYKSMVAFSYFARFLHQQDIPLDLELMFTPENVDWYVTTQLAEHSEDSRSTQRGALRQLGRVATRRAAWKPAEPQFRKPDGPEPYSEAEVQLLLPLPQHQRTPLRCRAFTGILHAGLGGGLRGQELESLTASDIEREDHLVFIRVRGNRARRIPVRREHAYPLLQLALDHPDGPLLGQFKRDQKNPLSSMKSRLELPRGVPPLEFRRLRATWMVTVLNEDLPLSAFAEIAGVTDLRISHLLPHLTTRKDRETITAMATGHAS